MDFSDKDKKRIEEFYTTALVEHGSHSAHGVHWADEFGQAKRFEILTDVDDIAGSNVLDVGCGFGDLYKFLLKNKIPVKKYTGIDIIPEYIAIAQERYPDTEFELKNIFDMTKMHDYVFASGSLNFKVGNYETFYFEMIKRMYSLAKKAMAFNMLNALHHVNNETFAAFHPDEVATFCETFCTHVQVIQGYLPQDFTIYMYKQS
jgi:trans-aconitate methyltransferase